MYRIIGRFGEQAFYDDTSEIERVGRELIEQLRSPEFVDDEEHAEEHDEVYLIRDPWVIKVQGSGLIQLYRSEVSDSQERVTEAGRERYMRDVTDSELIELFKLFVSGDGAAFDERWQTSSELPPYESDFYVSG